MQAMVDKNCYAYGGAADGLSNNVCSFEFHKGIDANRGPNPRTVLNSLSKPAPSKWDDAQKWIIGVSGRADHGHVKAVKPRNSNADERKNAFTANPKSLNPGEGGAKDCDSIVVSNLDEGETKKIDFSDSFWTVNKPSEDSCVIRSVCVRDMGTEMTPIGSQEPSRTATPIRATTPTMRSPIPSGTPSPPRHNQEVQSVENHQVAQGIQYVENHQVVQAISDNGIPTMLPGRTSFCGTRWVNKDEEVSEASKILQKTNSERHRRASMLDMRAMVWDEAESAKYMARLGQYDFRYKREEVKIQAWENHHKMRAEAEMRSIEAKAERMKSQAQERLANKIAVARRKADEKRANAEAKMHEQAVRTSDRADYIRRTGHLPISFRHLKFPSFCW